MTEPLNPEPTPGSNPGPSPEPVNEEPAGRDLAGTISAIAEEISERVTVLVDKATPVVRDAAARASDLVAKAGEAAGPVAHRAAGATADLGEKVAAKSRDWASDLRRSNQAASEPAESPPGEGASTEGGPGPTADTPTDQAAPAEPVDSATQPVDSSAADQSGGG